MSGTKFPVTQHLQVEDSYYTLSNRYVFRYRVELHNVDVENRSQTGKNHLSLSLLLGGAERIHLDMESNRNTYIGAMVVRGQAKTISKTMVLYTDINASVCPRDFDPEASLTFNVIEQSAEHVEHERNRHTAGQVVNRIIESRLHLYRYMHINHTTVGCRKWVGAVMRTLRQRNYLQSDADFDRGSPSLTDLINGQWDARYPRRIARTSQGPGLFLPLDHNPVEVDTEAVRETLSHASITTLRLLAVAVSDRNDEEVDIRDELEGWDSQHPKRRSRFIERISKLATLQPWEASAASDLTRVAANSLQEVDLRGVVSESFNEFHTYLAGRYGQALLALRMACEMLRRQNRNRDHTHRADILTLMLTVICNIAGSQDNNHCQE